MEQAVDYLPTLKSAIPENCSGCVAVRLAAARAAEAAIANCVTKEQAVEEFCELVGDDCPGPKTEGICGTTKTVCQYPLGEQALLNFWHQEEL